MIWQLVPCCAMAFCRLVLHNIWGGGIHKEACECVSVYVPYVCMSVCLSVRMCVEFVPHSLILSFVRVDSGTTFNGDTYTKS